MDIVMRDILPSDASSLAHILIEANEHAFRGLVPDRCLEFSEAESTTNWQRFFAEGLPAGDFMIAASIPTGQVIGYAWGGANTQEPDYAGELRQIMVLPAYQGQGIGRQLVCLLTQRLIEQGLNSMRVEVLRVNPNRLFYERLGGTLVSEQLYNWDGVILPKCVYGWADINSFLLTNC